MEIPIYSWMIWGFSHYFWKHPSRKPLNPIIGNPFNSSHTPRQLKVASESRCKRYRLQLTKIDHAFFCKWGIFVMVVFITKHWTNTSLWSVAESVAYTGMPASAALLSFEIGTCVGIRPPRNRGIGGRYSISVGFSWLFAGAWWRRGFCFRIWGELDSVESNHNLPRTFWIALGFFSTWYGSNLRGGEPREHPECFFGTKLSTYHVHQAWPEPRKINSPSPLWWLVSRYLQNGAVMIPIKNDTKRIHL